MSNSFTFALDRLLDGKREKIRGGFDPAFLQVQEEELKFPSPVFVEGEAYLAESDLVVLLSAVTKAMMPCAVCNEMWEVEVHVNHFYHTQPVDELKGKEFDWSVPLREALLTELPHYVECNNGKCPKREEIVAYLKEPSKKEKTTHFPFAGLE